MLGYVVIASKHNVAELEVCLEIKPDVLLVVVSDFIAKEGAAERFRSKLAEVLPHTQVHLLGSAGVVSLSGDDAERDAAWVREVFQPACAAWRRSCERMIINITGGTKLLAMLLKEAYDWDAIHYQALGKQTIQELTNTGNHLGFLRTIPCRKRAELPDIASLYNVKVEKSRPNPLFTSAACREVADALHQWALTEYRRRVMGEAVCHPWQPLAHWVVQSGVWWREGAENTATIAWEELLAGYPQVTREDVVQWAELLNQLDTSQRWIHWDEKNINLPRACKKETAKSKDWRRFIISDWFEWLMGEWLKEISPASQVAISIKAKDAEASQGREADVLWRNKGDLWVMELKVALPDGKTPRQDLDQLRSLEDGFGMAKKALVVSPYYLTLLDKQQRTALDKGYVSSEKVRVVAAISARSLYEALNSSLNFVGDEGVREVIISADV